MSSYQYVYVARHGQTVANVAQTVQGFDDVLTQEGHAQAVRLAQRAQHIKFDHLLVSDMVRAEETAAYIAEVTGKEIVSEPLLREAKQADSFVGSPGIAEAFQQFLTTERDNLHDPQWRFENAETFYDLRDRALKALNRFEEFGSEPLFVVSHGHFIRILVATVIMERELDPTMWLHVGRTLRTYNTGITIFRRSIETNHWSLLCFNDHAHFADN